MMSMCVFHTSKHVSTLRFASSIVYAGNMNKPSKSDQRYDLTDDKMCVNKHCRP